MRKTINFKIQNPSLLKKQLIEYSTNYEIFSFLDSTNFHHNSELNSNYDCILAAGSIKEIKEIDKNNFENLSKKQKEINDWLFGFLTYDLKNELEKLESNNFDGIKAPKLHFFQAKLIFILKNNQLSIEYLSKINSEAEIVELFSSITEIKITTSKEKAIPIKLKNRITKETYLKSVNSIRNHIKKGDIYEINFCQEFFATNTKINPHPIYQKMREVSPTPYSCFYKNKNIFVISATPERFLKKEGNKIISEPIKGTIKRGKNEKEDLLLAKQLENDVKERAENIMIVDLVRNDLAKTSKKGSVRVEELCKIYPFKQVHQMVSTISSEISENSNGIETIKSCFPMGSMTGAPKIRAMKLIEKYENTKRGIFSGSIGYIAPNGNFDFNVIIRTILYNSEQKYLSFMVGSAITNLSIAENEYNECLLKAEAMIKSL